MHQNWRRYKRPLASYLWIRRHRRVWKMHAENIISSGIHSLFLNLVWSWYFDADVVLLWLLEFAQLSTVSVSFHIKLLTFGKSNACVYSLIVQHCSERSSKNLRKSGWSIFTDAGLHLWNNLLLLDMILNSQYWNSAGCWRRTCFSWGPQRLMRACYRCTYLHS